MRGAANREHGHISRRVRSRWSGNRVSRVSGVGQVCRAVGERERGEEEEKKKKEEEAGTGREGKPFKTRKEQLRA